MKTVNWKIFHIRENSGDIFVEFSWENKKMRKQYKWNNDKDLLLQYINQDAAALSEQWENDVPVSIVDNPEIPTLSGSSILTETTQNKLITTPKFF